MLVDNGFSLSEALRYLEISRSTYYYKPKKYTRRTNDGEILKQIEEFTLQGRAQKGKQNNPEENKA